MWVPASTGSGESSLPGLQMAVLLQHPQGTQRQGGEKLSLISSYKDSHPTRMTSCKVTSQGLSSKYHHLGVRTSVYEFGGDTNIHSTTEKLENKEGK